MKWYEILLWTVFGLFLLWMVLPLTVYFCARMGVIGFRRGESEQLPKPPWKS